MNRTFNSEPPKSGPNDTSGYVQQHEAQSIRLGTAQLRSEAQGLGPRDKVQGGEHELDPRLVGGDVAKGQVAKPCVLGDTNAVLDASMPTVTKLELGDLTP